jgi:hypothetical protein
LDDVKGRKMSRNGSIWFLLLGVALSGSITAPVEAGDQNTIVLLLGSPVVYPSCTSPPDEYNSATEKWRGKDLVLCRMPIRSLPQLSSATSPDRLGLPTYG